MDTLQKQINEKEVADFYNKVEEIWPSNELWYKHTKKQIEKFVRKYAFENNNYVLNAGSGGYDYHLNVQMHHVDIAAEKIKHLPLYTIASIEKLPFAADTFDGVLCVGSVINYCDAIAAIAELSRVLKPGGKLLLEYENSYAYEYKNKSCYKANAQMIETIYQGNKQQQWVYSHHYINTILKKHGLKIISTHRFHIFSALMLYFGKNENSAARYAKFDIVGSHLPIINNHGSNFIVHCIKL